MEKEKLYHIALDDYEHGVVIRSLNDEKTKLMEEGKSADAVDDLLCKSRKCPIEKVQSDLKGNAQMKRDNDRQTAIILSIVGIVSGHMAGTSDCTFHKRRIAGK